MNIKEYEKIIKEIEEKDIGAVTKIEIVSHMMGFDEYEKITDTNKEKLLDFIYTYWLDNDLQEHTLYDVVDLVFNSKFYGFSEIIAVLDQLSYADFEKIVNEQV